MVSAGRQGGAHMGCPECIDTILNWTKLNWTVLVLLSDLSDVAKPLIFVDTI